jgi:hypothetical protein
MTETYSQNLETAEELPFPKATTTLKRTEVLLALWNRSLWLKGKIDNPRTKFDNNLKSRVYFAQVETQIYKTILYGLRDEELEIRVMELEKKLKNGVLIPHEQPK